MPPVTLASAPALDTFTTLEEYQARTPAVFFNAKPILHYHSRSVRACAPRSQLSKLPIFTQPANEQTGDAAGDNVVEQIEIFVSSEYV
jgi:nucleotide-sensitive chloride channel 1A